MRESPRLRPSRDYSLFETHSLNRRHHKDRILIASMKAHGFMPSSPLQVERTSAGKLRIIRGHHRFAIARQLGLEVWYVVDDSNTDIHALEGGQQAWTADDFAYSRAHDGNVDCERVLDFQMVHGLSLGAAASLVGGESAGSNNKVAQIKTGTFRATNDMSHANTVVSITDRCHQLGVRSLSCARNPSGVHPSRVLHDGRRLHRAALRTEVRMSPDHWQAAFNLGVFVMGVGCGASVVLIGALLALVERTR